MKASEWMAKNKPKKRASKLDAHRKQIEDLIEGGYTQQQVVEYLRSVLNIKTSQSNVHKFLSKKTVASATQKQKKEESKGKMDLNDHFKSLL